MEKRYGRAQFLRDAISLGLPTYSAFSRTALRRQRDRLILEHHPDHGGTESRAQEINERYARMIKWLNSRHRTGSRRTEAPLGGREPALPDPPRPLHMVATAAFWAAGALITSRFLAARRKMGS
jgi:hypothetical protein